MNSSKPLPTMGLTWFHYLSAAIFLATSYLAFRGIHLVEPAPGFYAARDKGMSTMHFEHLPILSSYTGSKGWDELLTNLVFGFVAGSTGMDHSFMVLQIYFLFSFVPMISMMTIESGRKGNRWSLISLPVVYHFLYQTTGGAIILPVWFVAQILTTTRSGYYSAESRAISMSFAKAIMPAVVLGYFVPCILLFAPIWSDVAHQKMIAFWQPCPLYVSLIVTVLSVVLPGSGVKSSDAKHVHAVYQFSFIMSCLLHFRTVAYCLGIFGGEPSVTLASVFDLRVYTSSSVLVNGLKYIFQLDYWIIFLDALLWSWLGIYDLRRAGKTQVGMLESGLYLVVGSVVLGPAAVLSFTWQWKERVWNESSLKKNV